MEHNTLQCRSTATIKNMGVNSYSQIVSAFRAQGDLTDDQLTILPVLQNALGISRERHTAEVKRALYDEQLSEIASSINPSSETTTNWEVEANYICPNIVHRPPNNEYVQYAEQILKTTPPTNIIQYPSSILTTKLNRDLQQLVRDEIKHDGIINATQQQPPPPPPSSYSNIIKPSFNHTDLTGSKVIRLVRAKQVTKRKTSLDTLIEVVQKELLRVNAQTHSISSSSSPPSQTRTIPTTKLHHRISQSTSTPHRSMMSSVLPSSHPASLTSQSFKITRKRGIMNFNTSKKVSLLQSRNKSFHNDDDDHHYQDIGQSTEDLQTGPENIEEIVRDTVDRLVAITILNNAPFVVNMLTAIPGHSNTTSIDSKGLTNTSGIENLSTIPKSDYHRHDHTFTGNNLRNSLDQTSPIKQQIHHSQLIIQPTTTTSISTIQGTAPPTLFVAPRILNFQTVVPKPTTNIQIGNTKIILVQPSNITQHLPHSTTPITNSQQQNLVNHSPVKLVKFTTTNTNNSITTRSTTLPINPTQTSTLTLPKNVQIVIPSRTHPDDSSKSLPTTTFRPMTTVPMPLTTCTLDQIPQATQEVTVTTSPTSSPPLTTHSIDLQSQQTSLGTIGNIISSNSTNQSAKNGTSQQQRSLPNSLENQNHDGSNVEKSRRRSSSSASIDKPVGKILRPITKVLPVYSPNNTSRTDSSSPTTMLQQQQSLPNITTTRTSPIRDEMIKSVAVNFPQQTQTIHRPTTNHGPMIYRMTSVNPNVPVFRVRATTAPTTTSIINKSLKTETKPIAVTTATSMCYEPKPIQNPPATSGSVSVLACIKTTKKRNKERAIMPRPSTIDSTETTPDLSQRLNPIITPTISTQTSLILNNDITNSNSSSDYPPPTSTFTSIPLVQQNSFSSTHSDENSSNIFSLSMQEHTNDTTTSSSNSIPISRRSTIESNMKSITTPNISPIQSAQSTPRPVMEDKCIQCINDEDDYADEQNSMEQEDTEPIDYEQGIIITNEREETKKRSADDDSWTTAAASLLHAIRSQDDYHLLDLNYQQILSTKFDILQTNLSNGVFISPNEFFQSVIDIKQNLLENNNVSKTSDDNLEKLFIYFENEFAKLNDQSNEHKRIRQ